MFGDTLGRNGRQPDQSHFLRPPQVVLQGAPTARFLPKNRVVRFAPPLPLPKWKESTALKAIPAIASERLKGVV